MAGEEVVVDIGRTAWKTKSQHAEDEVALPLKDATHWLAQLSERSVWGKSGTLRLALLALTGRKRVFESLSATPDFSPVTTSFASCRHIETCSFDTLDSQSNALVRHFYLY